VSEFRRRYLASAPADQRRTLHAREPQPQLRMTSDIRSAAERKTPDRASRRGACLHRPSERAGSATEPRTVRLNRLRQELASARARTWRSIHGVRLKASLPPRSARRRAVWWGVRRTRALKSLCHAAPGDAQCTETEPSPEGRRAAPAGRDSRLSDTARDTPKREQEFRRFRGLRDDEAALRRGNGRGGSSSPSMEAEAKGNSFGSLDRRSRP